MRRLSRGIVYSAPLVIAVAGLASLHAIVSDATGGGGYQMAVAGEAEGSAEAEADHEGQAEAEGEANAEGEGEAEGH